MTVKAVYEDGVLKPKTPLALEEHEEVELDVRRAPQPSPDDDPTGWKAIDALRGIGKAVAPDVSENHDEYLYSDPRD